MPFPALNHVTKAILVGAVGAGIMFEVGQVFGEVFLPSIATGSESKCPPK
jgi:hypothetical protein